MPAIPNPVTTALAASRFVRLHDDGEYGVTYGGQDYADLVPAEVINPAPADYAAVVLALEVAYRLNLPA